VPHSIHESPGTSGPDYAVNSAVAAVPSLDLPACRRPHLVIIAGYAVSACSSGTAGGRGTWPTMRSMRLP